MTHKNPALRANTNVPSANDRSKSPAPGKKPKPESMRMKKPPKKVLEGNKWIIVCAFPSAISPYRYHRFHANNTRSLHRKTLTRSLRPWRLRPS